MKKIVAIFLMAVVMFSASASLVKATSIPVNQAQLQAKQKLEAKKTELKRKEADRKARNAAYNAAIKKAQDERRAKIAAANKAYQEALKKAKQLLDASKPLVVDNSKVIVDNTKQKERDNKRLSDLRQLQTALELYYTDQSSYPVGASAVLGSANFACLNTKGFTTTGCVSPYMGLVPSDPLPAQSYFYTRTNNGSSYTLTAKLETTVSGLSGGVTVSPSGIAD